MLPAADLDVSRPLDGSEISLSVVVRAARFRYFVCMMEFYFVVSGVMNMWESCQTAPAHTGEKNRLTHTGIRKYGDLTCSTPI